MISVIVPNHNRDLTFLKESLRRSTYKDWELIEVNLGFERSKQRNIGIDRAKGGYFLILDSDQSISPGLMTECVTLMRLGCVALYIPEIIVANGFFGKIRMFERSFMVGTAADVPRFIRREHCPLFDESMSGPEDADWGQRIRGPRGTTAHPLYHHDNIGFLAYCRKKAYYTKSMKKYIDKWPNDPCMNFKYRCWTIFTENGKWRRLLKHPILTLGVVFLLAVRGGIFYANK